MVFVSIYNPGKGYSGVCVPSIIQAKDIVVCPSIIQAKDIVVFGVCVPSIIQAKDIVVFVSIYNPGKGYSGVCVHL